MQRSKSPSAEYRLFVFDGWEVSVAYPHAIGGAPSDATVEDHGRRALSLALAECEGEAAGIMVGYVDSRPCIINMNAAHRYIECYMHPSESSARAHYRAVVADAHATVAAAVDDATGSVAAPAPSPSREPVMTGRQWGVVSPALN
jgi:hypothetical protein